MTDANLPRVWTQFLDAAKEGTRKGATHSYRINFCKTALKLSDTLIEHGYNCGDRFDVWEEYICKVFYCLEGQQEMIERTVKEYFLLLHTGDAYDFSIDFLDKTEEMSIGLVCDVKYSGLRHRFYIKAHQRGPRSSSSFISSRYNADNRPYIQELYIYKLLSMIQVCGEVHFMAPLMSDTKKFLLIGTQELKFTIAKKLSAQEANPRALVLVHFLQFVLRLEDIGANGGNYGQDDKGEPVIIEFWFAPKDDFTVSDDQIQQFWEKPYSGNSRLITEVLAKVTTEQKKKWIHEAMEQWFLMRRIEEAKSAVEELLVKLGERVETSGDLCRYVRDMRANVTKIASTML